MSFLSCSEGSSFAFCITLFKKYLSSYYIFYCSCFISICSWAFLTFLLLLCWELSCLLLESWPPLVSVAILLTFVVDTWAMPVPVWEFPVFLDLVFLSSFSLRRYSAAPGTSYLEWMSMACFSSGRQLKGLIKKELNYLSTFFLISSPSTSY